MEIQETLKGFKKIEDKLAVVMSRSYVLDKYRLHIEVVWHSDCVTPSRPMAISAFSGDWENYQLGDESHVQTDAPGTELAVHGLERCGGEVRAGEEERQAGLPAGRGGLALEKYQQEDWLDCWIYSTESVLSGRWAVGTVGPMWLFTEISNGCHCVRMWSISTTVSYRGSIRS